MNKEENIKQKIKLENNTNRKFIQYFPFQKNMLTISYEIPLGLTKLSFYIINGDSSKLDFCITFNNDLIYDRWQLHISKSNKLYLIGYMDEYQDFLEKKNNKKLGIFLLDISKRTIEKIKSFKYNHSIIDKKEDKIFITNNGAIISYDFLTNISKQKAVKQTKTFYQKFLLVQNYLLLINMTEVIKWLLGIYEIIIIDKNLENKIRKFIDPIKFQIGDFNDYGFLNYKNGFVKISDNKYFICYEDDFFCFLKFNLIGNENLFNDRKKLPDLFDDKVITIKEKKTITTFVCSLDERNFIINLDNNIFYLCDAENLQKKLKFNLNIPLFKSNGNNLNNQLEEKDKLLTINIKGPHYEFIFVNKNNEILVISNK